MTALTLSSPAIEFFQSPSFGSVDALETLLKTLVASWHVSERLLQNRKWHRVALSQSFAITPLNDTDEPQNAATAVASGRDISLGGIAFTHVNPLPHRLVAITFASDVTNVVSIVTRLKWCRFRQDGSYLSGGKFLRACELGHEADIEWLELPQA